MKPVIKKYHKTVFIVFMSLVMLITGFSCGSSPTKTTASPTQPPSAARTGDIKTGTKVEAATQSIDSSGGTIAVSKPGDPLDGFVIDVPADSYAGSKTFSISYAPITGQTFGSDINPISPMITVDNGGDYADEIMYVRVPVQVPDGYFAMGFLYDETTKQLEGMPLVGSDADSITVATSHFSHFFISMIEESLLKKNIESGFLPHIDDWQFENLGSYITQGNCNGQSIAAMWYYYAKPDGKEACLYGRYDNNGNQPETPGLWEDDSLGYRFCSVIQDDYLSSGVGSVAKWGTLSGIAWKHENNTWERIEIPGISDASQWRLFAYSIQASGQPQLIIMNNNAGAGHAMICYAVNGNGTLLVTDPNYPGRDDRKIEYADGKFKPYSSGATADAIKAGNGTVYDKITYAGAWTIVPYDAIAGRWTEFQKGTIGDGRFPAYVINVEDDSGAIIAPLTDGYSTDQKMLLLQVTSRIIQLTGPIILGQNVYRDGAWLPFDNKGAVELKPGNNLLGIYVRGQVCFPGQVNATWRYVDFKYFNVIYNSLAIDPASLDGAPNKEYTFTAKADAPPAGARYDWYVDGSKSQSNTSTSFTTSFKSEGSHKVSVKLVDKSGKEIADAQSDVTISAAATSGLQQLQQTNLFRADFYCDQFLYNRWTPTQAVSPYSYSDTYSIPENGDWMVITWNGASFSGEKVNIPGTGFTQTDEVKGTVSSDGKTLLSLEYNYSGTNDYDGRKIVASYKWQNIPIGITISENPQNYIVKMEYSLTDYAGVEKVMEITLQSPPVKEYKYLSLGCSFFQSTSN